LTAQEVIQILGPESPEPSEHNYRDERPEQTPETTPLHDSSMSEALEPIQVYTEEMQEEQEMRNQAESLHIFDQGVQDFMAAPHITTNRIGDTLHAFATRTEESRTQTAHIDPNTGHVIDPDEVAAHRAAGPDRADPPKEMEEAGEDIPSAQEGAEAVEAEAVEVEAMEVAEILQEREEDTTTKTSCLDSTRTPSPEIAQRHESS
jgi:hypothetical protein